MSESSSFVRKLAHNDPAIRNSAFRSLEAYLQSPSAEKLKLIDFEKLWKGLWFSMWFCDKPIPQQNLAGDLGKLFSETVKQKQLKTFHEGFWVIVHKEWYSIDKWRLDKYLMMVRRVIRHQLFRLRNNAWPEDQVQDFLEVLKAYPLCNDVKFPQSLAYHVVDLFLDEIEYVIFEQYRDYSEEMDNDDSEEQDSDSDSDSESETEQEAEKSEKKDTKEKDSSKPTKEEILAQTPIAKLLEPFRELAEVATNEAMRKRCTDEVLEDQRIKEWGVVATEDSEADESEEEWNGF